MKKIISFMMLLAMVVSSAMCFATEGISEDKPIEIDNFEDADSVMQGGYSQNELKEYYEEYIKMMSEYYDTYERTDVVKARVIGVEDIKVIYNADYYNVYKINYQPIEIEILEGEYKGKIINTDFILTGNSFGNIQIPSVKVGDKIFVSLEEEDGEIKAYTTNFDTCVSRSGWMIGIAVIAIFLIVLYAGRRGIQSILLTVLVISLLLVITIPEVLQGANIILLSLIDSIVIIAVHLINKMGLHKSTCYAFLTAFLVVLFAALLTYGINYITAMSGYTFEVVTLSESIVNKNIDFEALYMLSIIGIASILVSDVVSKIFEVAQEDAMNVSEEAKKILADKINTIVIFTIVFLMPKLLVFLGAYKYPMTELMQSEMFMSEIARMLIWIIALTLSVPFSTIMSKFLIKKESNTENEIRLDKK